MYCVVTAGPTYEPLDQVRRLTNMSTGRLGTELALYLEDHGHDVTLLRGEQATYRGARMVQRLNLFSTTLDLRAKLETLGGSLVQAVFHAAAVNDFSFGKIWQRTSSGPPRELAAGKVSSREAGLMVELVPTPKIIACLRGWFPRAALVGWKYEVDGGRPQAQARAQQQVAECHLTASVVNGPAYGSGYGLVRSGKEAMHLPAAVDLYGALQTLLDQFSEWPSG